MPQQANIGVVVVSTQMLLSTASSSESASGLFRKEVGRQIRMRRVPMLIFKMDHSMEYGKHIDEILSTMDFDSYQKDEEEDFDDFLE